MPRDRYRDALTTVFVGFTAGQTIPTQTAPKLLLTLGNASVKMKVNGAAVAVAQSASAIGYLLTPTGASPLPASKEPKCL